MPGQAVNIEEIKSLYLDQSLSIRNVGLTLHISTERVKDYLKQEGIQIRHGGGSGKPIKFSDVEMDKLYIQQQLSPNEVSRVLGVSRHAIVRYLKRRGIFSPRRPKIRRGADSPRWKGGRFRTKDGYIVVKLQPSDFFYPMADKQGRVREHRLIMARHLNRCLLPWEIVHHKNGIRDDNRLENLKLVSSQTSHLASIYKTAYVSRLEKKVAELEKEVRLLKWQIKELNRERASFCSN